MTNNDLVDKIKSVATVWDAAAVCGVHLPTRAGIKIKVPWREDRKPSATVTADGLRVIDWSSGESEDAAGIIGRINGASFPLAMNLLGARLGMGQPFSDAEGWGESSLFFASAAADFDEPAEPVQAATVESNGIANMVEVTDASADAWLKSCCLHLLNDSETAEAVAAWRGLPIELVLRLASEGRLGSCGVRVWMPCKTVNGLQVRAQVRKIGPREAGSEFFWPLDSEHKPGLWLACDGGPRVVVAEGWGDAAAALAMLGPSGYTIAATLGTGARKLEGVHTEAGLLLRQNDDGDANGRWARSIRALWPTISVKSLIPPSGIKDWNDVVKRHGLELASELLSDAGKVADDEVVSMSPEMAQRKATAYNETMASEVFMELADGDLRHDDSETKAGEWYAWAKTHWQPGAEKQAMETAKKVQFKLAEEARALTVKRTLKKDGEEDKRKKTPNELLEAFAGGMGQARSVQNILRLASSDPRVAVKFREVKRDSMMLPCRNGMFDLHAKGNGFSPAKRSDFIVQRAGVAFDEDATCPVWMRFLNDIFEGDRARISFIQRWFGYCLTGDVKEQKLLFLYGNGSNGKSTLCEVLLSMLGELGAAVPATMVVLDRQGGDAPDCEVVRLRGARVALAPEIDKNAKLNESRVKGLTGGDRLRGRELYAMSVEFSPTHKLVFFGNHKPLINGGDDGIWRRFIFMHLRIKFEGARKDGALKDKLLAELPGILNWAIAGCWDWQRQGLAVPASVTGELLDYRENSDSLGSFLGEKVQALPGFRVTLKELRSKVIEWAKDSGESWMADNMSVQKLRRELEDRGWKVEKTKQGIPFIAATWKTANPDFLEENDE